MRNISILCVFILLISLSLQAKQTDNIPGYYAMNGNLYGSIIFDENNYLVYGSSGIFKRTSDGGKTWTQKYSGTPNHIFSMTKKDERLFAIGSNGLFMSSTDRGNKWKIQYLNDSMQIHTGGNLQGFAINEQNVGMVISAANEIFITNNFGLDFVKKSNPFPTKSTTLFASKEEFIAGTENNSIYISKDNGESWSEKNFSSLGIYMAKVIKILSYRDVVLILSDKGLLEYNPQKDELKTLPANYYYTSFDVYEDKIYLVGEDFSNLMRLYAYKYDEGKVEQKEVILSSTEFTKSSIKDCKLVNEDKILCVGMQNTILMSNDEVNEIDIISNLEIKNSFSSYCKWLSKQIAFVVSKNKEVYRTNDAGITWKKSQVNFKQDNGGIKLIYPIFSDNIKDIYALYDDNLPYLLVSNDSGKTFNSQEYKNMGSGPHPFYNYGYIPFKLNDTWYSISNYLDEKRSTYINKLDSNLDLISQQFIDSANIVDIYQNKSTSNRFYLTYTKWNFLPDSISPVYRGSTSKLYRAEIINDTLRSYIFTAFDSDSLLCKIYNYKIYYENDNNGYMIYYIAVKDQFSFPVISGILKFQIVDQNFYYKVLKQDTLSDDTYQIYNSINNKLYIITSKKVFEYNDKSEEWISYPFYYASILSNEIYRYGDKSFLLGWLVAKDNVILFKNIEPEFYTSVETTEIQEKAHLQSFAPYPIPATSKIQSRIYWNQIYQISDADLSVYDIFGNKLLAPNLYIDASESYTGILTWECDNIDTGIYFIRVSLQNETINIPVTVYR